jgi:hypothetical protein
MKFSTTAVIKAQPPIAAKYILVRVTLIAGPDRLHARRLENSWSKPPPIRLIICAPTSFGERQRLVYRFVAGVTLPTLRSLTTSALVSMSTRTTPHAVTCHHLRPLADLGAQGYIERRHGVGSFARQPTRSLRRPAGPTWTKCVRSTSKPRRKFSRSACADHHHPSRGNFNLAMKSPHLSTAA